MSDFQPCDDCKDVVITFLYCDWCFESYTELEYGL